MAFLEKHSANNNFRRNYRTRTYSGAILLHSDRQSNAQKAISAISDNLSWYLPRNLQNGFPPLTALDRDIEFKLMDIIMGQDPLNERVDHDLQSQRNYNSNNAKLPSSGKKKFMLQERHGNYVRNSNLDLEWVYHVSNEKIVSLHFQFIDEWKKLAKGI
jgi:hypothetical protein